MFRAKNYISFFPHSFTKLVHNNIYQMGKKVVYGIRFTRTLSISEEFKEHVLKYKDILAQGKAIQAAETIVEVTEWLLDESDEMNDPEDDDIMKLLPETIKYSRRAIKLLEDREAKELLPRYHKYRQLVQYDLIC